ncbi:MAG: outer membrane beta-barrel protein [Chitinophagaceae bacterium]|nr:outer membrane beta-barrel protein [Chitinophagaceae bacterium]
MSNNIPIDELFREKLSGGKEQLNLGAWANMERMLNGQNPYTVKDEEPKRKRILPFFLVFLTLSAVVSAGYLYYNHDGQPAQSKSIASAASSVISHQNAGDHSLPSSNNIPVSPNQINLSQSEISPNQIDLSHTSRQSAPGNSNHLAIHKSKQPHAGQPVATATSLPDHSMQTAEAGDELTAQEAVKPRVKPLAKQGGKLLASAGQDAGEVMKNSYKEAGYELNVMAAASDVTEKTKIEKRHVKRTVAQVREDRNRNGSTNRILLDTIEESNIDIDKQVAIAAPAVENVIRDKNYKWHPRYVVGAENYVPVQDVLQSQAPAALMATASTPHLETPADEKSKKQSDGKKNVLTTLGAFTGATLAKIGESGSNFFRLFTVLDPGISLGVNAALFKTQHNYGGFHGGITNHTAISETFSIISEIKFFIRNNSGFTINDIRTIIKTTSEDSLSMPGKTIYTYQIDSATQKYNFKNFMSLELPVMLSARFGNLSVYGGPNFVYNMKLKINEIDKSYLIDREVTVENGTPFKFPYDEEKSMQYARSDFGARFGIGYAVGMSYNFNPNIYLDIRLNKVMWDNTTTNSQRAISNGVTKVPFTQLSLGYKFKNK